MCSHKKKKKRKEEIESEIFNFPHCIVECVVKWRGRNMLDKFKYINNWIYLEMCLHCCCFMGLIKKNQNLTDIFGLSIFKRNFFSQNCYLNFIYIFQNRVNAPYFEKAFLLVWMLVDLRKHIFKFQNFFKKNNRVFSIV